MIVDDDAEMRTLLAEYFRRLGFDVAEKESGPIALQAVTNERFDCFILDVAMPEMSGIELLKKLRDRGIDTPRKVSKRCCAAAREGPNRTAMKIGSRSAISWWIAGVMKSHGPAQGSI